MNPVYPPTYLYQPTSVPSDRVRIITQLFDQAYFTHPLRTIIGSLPTLPETPSQGDETLLKSLEALQAGDYIHSLTLVNEAIEQGISFDLGKTEALNIRGSFKYV